VKTCRECGDLLEVGENWSRGFQKARQYICNVCSTLTKKKKRHQGKLDAIEYLGGECRDCGKDNYHPSIYEFHHLDPRTKTANPSQYLEAFSRDKLFKELDKCVLLCANCHRLRHYEEKERLV